ncbi:MAG TPA: alpha/beta hydrolase [Acidimicrobiia bacterium]|nr:alpha/beta hydrolase [Acidimicrobiia bacterium]
MPLRALFDGALFAESYGEGPPRVLALHGWGRRGNDFARSLAGFDALAVDLPGFGATPAPAEPIGARGYADVLAPVLEMFDSPPALLGHSFGGRIAVCLAAASPERVGPLVVTGTPLLRKAPSRKPSVGYRLIRTLNQAGLVSDRRIEEIRRSRGSADYRAATGVMRDILVKVVNETYEDELGRLESRVMLLWGGEDHEVPVEVAEESLRLIRRSGGSAELEVLDGVGHLVPTQAPDALARVLEEVMAR